MAVAPGGLQGPFQSAEDLAKLWSDGDFNRYLKENYQLTKTECLLSDTLLLFSGHVCQKDCMRHARPAG